MQAATRFYLVFIAIAGISTSVNAQSFTIDSSKNAIDVSGSYNGAEIHLPAVKSHPEYPDGIKAWHDFLRSNINIAIPFSNRVNPGIYKVMVRFIIGSDGKVYGVRADSNCGYGMESEVIRSVMKSPVWKPAETSSGKKVSFMLRIFVNFIVKRNDIIVSFND